LNRCKCGRSLCDLCERLRAAAIKLHETLNTYWQGDCEKADVIEAQSKLCDILSTTPETSDKTG